MASFKLRYFSLLETTMLKNFKNYSVCLLHCKIITKYTTIRLTDEVKGHQSTVNSLYSSNLKLYISNTVSSIMCDYVTLLANN